MSKNNNKSASVFGPNILDTRVRERFLAGGQLDAKTLEKHLGELPDIADAADNVGLRQPALSATVEVEDDEDEDEDEDEGGEP
jgi:hypothetical protein